MSTITWLGEEYFFMLFLPVLYWAISPTIGLRVGFLLLTSNGLLPIFKMVFHAPRPFWLDPAVKALRFETSFGIPSGHAQTAVAVWTSLAGSLRKTWAWVVAILVCILIGFSRMVLGVHFPTDVLGGWLTGTVLVLVVFRLEKPVLNWLKQQSLGWGITILFLYSVVIILVALIVRASLGNWQLPAVWAQNAALAYPDLAPGELAINPLAIAGAFTSAGTLFGLTAGALFLFRRGGFTATGVWWKRVLRTLIGLVGVVIIWQGLGFLFPGGETALAFALRFIRYFLVGAWVAAIGPLIFKRIRLAM